jgi:hypothetical protein
MIFVAGLICAILGFISVRIFGCTPIQWALKQYNMFDYIGILVFFLGILLMIVSFCIKVWHYMP